MQQFIQDEKNFTQSDYKNTIETILENPAIHDIVGLALRGLSNMWKTGRFHLSYSNLTFLSIPMIQVLLQVCTCTIHLA